MLLHDRKRDDKKFLNLLKKHCDIEQELLNLFFFSEKIEIEDLKEKMPHGSEFVFIGELVHKNPRNANEDAEIKKRGGKIETGQLEYLDLRLRDDSGMIGGRIGRKDYLRIGVEIAERVPVGAHLLIRAKFWNGIRYAFITKWKWINKGEKEYNV